MKLMPILEGAIYPPLTAYLLLTRNPAFRGFFFVYPASFPFPVPAPIFGAVFLPDSRRRKAGAARQGIPSHPLTRIRPGGTPSIAALP